MNNQLSELKAKLESSKSVLVVIPSHAQQDVVAAALSLYLSLSQSGKAVVIVSSTDPVVRDSHLVGLDKITHEVGGNNLVITLGVPEDAIDKVTSNTEGGHLNLIINPREGAAPITDKDLSFSYSGSAADAVIVVGAADLKDVGPLAEKESELFTPDKLVNLSNQVGTFGSINLTDPSSSNSELITALLKELALPLDVDIANNLMQGIEAATDGLRSPNMTADTFEALAVLYRTGARRTPPVPAGQTAKIVSDVPVMESAPSRPVQKAETAKPKEEWSRPKILTTKSN